MLEAGSHVSTQPTSLRPAVATLTASPTPLAPARTAVAPAFRSSRPENMAGRATSPTYSTAGPTARTSLLPTSVPMTAS
eukprot:CAMPEP_0194290902 /NCGR_PEP_ID=MMETSP0169-20130528/42299_1 /TAXON_ID=218684 /ORGANISM="Corethron pennatum, Strain L29A3" /LENGTH=78 /DNA_ID=CAMNT_0039038629 /DNA_START=284 /DNA_END=516 /DNA_ORIENTATION=+